VLTVWLDTSDQELELTLLGLEELEELEELTELEELRLDSDRLDQLEEL